MALLDYQSDVHALARKNGWYDNVDPLTPVWAEKCIANIHGELSEALDCVAKGRPDYFEVGSGILGQGHKPEGLGIELADVAIRMMDFLECLGHRAELMGCDGISKQDVSPIEIASAICRLHKILAACTDSFGNPRLENCTKFLECVQVVALTLGIDLEEMVRIKHTYNKTRSYRHGGKTL